MGCLRFVVWLLAVAELSAQVRPAPEEQLRMAQMLETAGDYAGAARLYERLHQMYPDSVPYVLGLARVLLRQQRPAEALTVLTPFVRRRPDAVAVWAKVGEAYWRAQQPDSARWAWAEALRRAPDRPESYRDVALAQYEVQLVDDAIATLQQGRRQLRSDTLFADELSQWYVRLGDVERGIKEVLQLLRIRQELYTAQSRVLLYLALPGAAERIRSLLQRSVQEYPRDQLIHRLFIWFLQEIGDDAAALEAVRRLERLQGGNGMELLQFADAARQSGKPDVALHAYEELLQLRPARTVWLQALYGYAQAAELLLRQGARGIPWQRVRQEYEELVRQADTLPIGADVLFSLGLFLRDVARDRVGAADAFQKLLQRFPRSRPAALARVELARLALARGDLSEAERLLQPAVDDSIVPEAGDWARFWQAEIEFFRGNTDSARALYAILALRPSSPAANDALQRLVLFEENPAPELLRRFAEAEWLFLQERFRQARAAYMQVVEAADTGSALAERALIRAAEAAIADGDLNAAQQLLTRLFAEHEDVLYGDRALLLLGDVLEQQGRRAEALSVYQQFLLRYPNSIYLPEVRRRFQRLREGAELRGSGTPALESAEHRVGHFPLCC